MSEIDALVQLRVWVMRPGLKLSQEEIDDQDLALWTVPEEECTKPGVDEDGKVEFTKDCLVVQPSSLIGDSNDECYGSGLEHEVDMMGWEYIFEDMEEELLADVQKQYELKTVTPRGLSVKEPLEVFNVVMATGYESGGPDWDGEYWSEISYLGLLDLKTLKMVV